MRGIMESCPVCAGEARVDLRLDAAYIRARLARELGAAVPPDVAIGDYALRRCGACDLVFADPMRAGDAAFYRWVTAVPHYRAEDRWEWGAVRRILAGRGPTRLLELGCGEGLFLASLAGLKHVQAEGIDLSEASVNAARARGLNARCIPLEAVLREGKHFDVIVMSHVLEHVEDPLKIAADCKRLLDAGGELMFSVPYSPTSREYREHDIMNLPPHHLTRWNLRALTRLAEITGMSFAFEMRRPKPLWKRAVRHTVESVRGTAGETGPAATLGILLTHPRRFAQAVSLFRSREKVAGRRAADEILVCLKL
jgi:SAM-dependent methyltransferase